MTCHLGAGASLAAVRDGRSVDTTMGFTPLEGLAMATRSGTVDPGLVLWLAEHGGLSTSESATGSSERPGCWASRGRRTCARSSPAPRRRIPPALLALASSSTGCGVHRGHGGGLGGIDALVFTGGIGERSAPIRALTAEGLAFLGIAVDPVRNESDGEDRLVSPDEAAVGVVVVAAREDLEIAREVRAVFG